MLGIFDFGFSKNWDFLKKAEMDRNEGFWHILIKMTKFRNQTSITAQLFRVINLKLSLDFQIISIAYWSAFAAFDNYRLLDGWKDNGLAFKGQDGEAKISGQFGFLHLLYEWQVDDSIQKAFAFGLWISIVEQGHILQDKPKTIC